MFHILLIEDSEDDALLFERALEREGINSTFRRVHNGAEAVAYLEGEGKYGDRTRSPFPNVVFSDIKMPRMDGFAILDWVKSEPKCAGVPIMMLSDSRNHGDVQKAYRLGANAYLIKPSSLSELQAILRAAHEFWRRCATVSN